MTTTRNNPAAALDAAQQRLTRLLLAAVQAIIEAGDLVARLEREAMRKPLLTAPLFRKPAR